MDRPDGDDWETRLERTWSRMDALVAERGEDGFRAAVEVLAAELPAGSAVADFERGCAHDSTGLPEAAVRFYRAALRTGLTGLRRRRAVVQLASSLRNTGRPQESVALLRAELARAPEEGPEAAEVAALEDAVRATLALALTDLGRAREGVSLVLTALAPHLPRYQRSMAAYARLLMEDGPAPDGPVPHPG
ncbi:tetratricopeptide repeat protein [Streptomyces albus]|uniref:tetratricopeptide repeat protein n=1 Tax=Streptomyces albus TaxID=1888 RepID=UPI0024AD9A7D|nr:tetratricopeptide repeat protein [Streptomyces albus]MDI6411553.1 tetratricopeptide repeat protein [Streptomyces albus]